jgi:hypothetical protein
MSEVIELYEFECPECEKKFWVSKGYLDEDLDPKDVLHCAHHGYFKCMSSEPSPTGRFVIVEYNDEG